jgi:Fe2+ or Zn2+ uptake regulation protein
MNIAQQALRNAGLRATKERLALYAELAKAKKPMTAESLKTRLKDVDLVTVYRNLETFAGEGLIERLSLHATHAHYEIKHKHHHHVVCEKCDRITSVDACLPKGFIESVRRKSGVKSITRHQLEFYGLCGACTKK